MKKLIILAIAIFSLSSCLADGKKEVVAVKDIPSAAQQILSSHFADGSVTAVIKETELFKTEYEVMFEGGAKIVFDADGVWKKIDCQRKAVPEKLVPAEIRNKVKASFPKAFIVEIEKDGKGFDVELNNGLDLKFNKKFKMTIDD